MSWTKKDQAKLREYQTAQMTVKEIAVKMQRPQQLIRAELEAMGYKPIEDKPKAESEFLTGFQPVEIKRKPYAKITTSVEKKVCELREKCMTTTQIAKKLNIGSQQTVANILKRNGYSTKRGEYHKLSLEDITKTKEDKPMKVAKVNEEFDKAVSEMIAEAKEKEPAPIAAETDSAMVEKEVLFNNDNINIKKSQPLTGVRMLGELENLLREIFTEQLEITSLSGELDVASIKFRLDGEGYWISFGPQQDVPMYGKEVRK